MSFSLLNSEVFVVLVGNPARGMRSMSQEPMQKYICKSSTIASTCVFEFSYSSFKFKEKKRNVDIQIKKDMKIEDTRFTDNDWAVF